MIPNYSPLLDSLYKLPLQRSVLGEWFYWNIFCNVLLSIAMYILTLSLSLISTWPDFALSDYVTGFLPAWAHWPHFAWLQPPYLTWASPKELRLVALNTKKLLFLCGFSHSPLFYHYFPYYKINQVGFFKGIWWLTESRVYCLMVKPASNTVNLEAF